MLKSLERIRIAMLGLFVVYSITLACGALVASEETSDGESAAASENDTVVTTAWPAGAMNNTVRMNYFSMEPAKVLILSFPDYDGQEVRQIDPFQEVPSQVDSAQAGPAKVFLN